MTDQGCHHELRPFATTYDPGCRVDAAAGRRICGHRNRPGDTKGRLGIARVVAHPVDDARDPCIEPLAAIDELAYLIEIELWLRLAVDQRAHERVFIDAELIRQQRVRVADVEAMLIDEPSDRGCERRDVAVDARVAVGVQGRSVRHLIEHAALHCYAIGWWSVHRQVVVAVRTRRRLTEQAPVGRVHAHFCERQGPVYRGAGYHVFSGSSDNGCGARGRRVASDEQAHACADAYRSNDVAYETLYWHSTPRSRAEAPTSARSSCPPLFASSHRPLSRQLCHRTSSTRASP